VSLSLRPLLLGSRHWHGFVHHDQLRSRANELIASSIALYEVRRNNRVRKRVEQGFVCTAVAPFETPGRSRPGPARRQGETFRRAPAATVRRGCGGHSTQNRETVPFVEQLPDDQTGLNRLTDPNVVGDEEANRVETERP